MNTAKKIECTYGKKCYRLNPTHFLYNSHSHLDTLASTLDSDNIDNIVIPDNFDTSLPLITIKEQIKIILSQKKKPPASQTRPLDNTNDSPNSKKVKLNNGSPSSEKNKFGEGTSTQQARSRQEALQKQAKQSQGNRLKIALPQIAQQKCGDMAERWLAAAPYHMFLTRIEDSSATHKEKLSITFSDLYDGSLGELEESLQINFMIDIHFLIPILFEMGVQKKPLLMLHETSNAAQTKLPDHITFVEVKKKSAFGHHHTKMSLMYYKDKSLRVAVSTANLIPDDWKNYTQGVWISPACPYISDASTTGESTTGFKASLRSYLTAYQLPQLNGWLDKIKHADFSEVKVCLIASVPSTGPIDINKWGLGRLRTVLRQHLPSGVTSVDWPAIVQCSSIGSLGATPQDWLEGQMKSAMLGSSSVGPNKTPLYMIYPSLSDVQGSHDGMLGGGCLPYSRMTHSKQLWLLEFLHRWRAEKRHRSQATPHIKTYCRISPDMKSLAWFLLTSANLSKAAWGRSTHQGSGQNIMSYEAGVLFLPKFLLDKNVFEVGHSGDQDDDKFPVPFDVPLTKYSSSDKPWVSEFMMS